MEESENPNPEVEGEKRVDESANPSPEGVASSSLNAGARPYIPQERVAHTFFLQPVFGPTYMVIPPAEASTSTPAHVTHQFGVCFSYIFNF